VGLPGLARKARSKDRALPDIVGYGTKDRTLPQIDVVVVPRREIVDNGLEMSDYIQL